LGPNGPKTTGTLKVIIFITVEGKNKQRRSAVYICYLSVIFYLGVEYQVGEIIELPFYRGYLKRRRLN
jgi:hypothetical protein